MTRRVSELLALVIGIFSGRSLHGCAVFSFVALRCLGSIAEMKGAYIASGLCFSKADMIWIKGK